MIITIDGPAGTGKTTVAREVAEKLDYLYFDSGAMYRALTYSLLKAKISIDDDAALAPFLEHFTFDIRSSNHKKEYFVADENVTEQIRSPEVTQKVSEVSASPKIRAALMSIQQDFGKEKNAVFEGRDMGTVVFPEAACKVFLTARPAVRAERRYKELEEKRVDISQAEVLEAIMKRDHFDSTREIAPLKQAEDAHLLDTSDLTLDQVIDQVLALIGRVS